MIRPHCRMSPHRSHETSASHSPIEETCSVFENAQQALRCDRRLMWISEGVIHIGHGVDAEPAIHMTVTINVDRRPRLAHLAIQRNAAQYWAQIERGGCAALGH